jgi:hypothetical protein
MTRFDPEATLENGEFCIHASTTVAQGGYPQWSHVGRCPACLLRWRVRQAHILRWEPLARNRLELAFQDMVDDFIDGAEAESCVFQGFYAALAADPNLEERFVNAVRTGLDSGRAPSAGFMAKLQVRLDEVERQVTEPASVHFFVEWAGLAGRRLDTAIRHAEVAAAPFRALSVRSWVDNETPPSFRRRTAVAVPRAATALASARATAEHAAAIALPLGESAPVEVALEVSEADPARALLSIQRRDVGSQPLTVRVYRGLNGSAVLTQELMISPEDRVVSWPLDRSEFSNGQLEIRSSDPDESHGARERAQAEVLSEPIPWQSDKLTPNQATALLTDRLRYAYSIDLVENGLRAQGAVVERSEDTLYATIPAGRTRVGGAQPIWVITCSFDGEHFHLSSLQVKYLAGK